MKKRPEVARRIEKWRLAQKMSQQELAKMFGVSRPALSAYETGATRPPAQVLAKLTNLARGAEATWFLKSFLKQAGIDEESVLSAADAILERRGVPATNLRIISIPALSKGPKLELPARFVPNPRSTVYLRLDDDSTPHGVYEGDYTTHGVRPGDVVVFEHRRHAKDGLQPFWGEVVLAEYKDAPARHFYVGLLDGKLEETTGWFLALLYPPGRATGFPIGGWKPRPQARREEWPTKVQPYPGWRILGRVVAWFRPPRELTK